jgi:hypothetical protein
VPAAPKAENINIPTGLTQQQHKEYLIPLLTKYFLLND